MSALSDADYVVLILQNSKQDRATEISTRLETGDLRLQKKNTAASNLTTVLLAVLSFSALAFFVVFVAGLGWHLLQWAW